MRQERSETARERRTALYKRDLATTASHWPVHCTQGRGVGGTGGGGWGGVQGGGGGGYRGVGVGGTGSPLLL